MAEMWGIAGGIRNYRQDLRQLQALALQQQEAQNLERHREAQRIATNTELEQRERKLLLEEESLGRQRQTEEVMAQPGEGEDLTTPAGQIKAMRERANRFMALGRTEEASKLLNTSAQTLVRLENAANAESQARDREFKLQSEQTRRLQEALTGVRSQADFDRAKLAIAAMPEMEGVLDHPLLQRYDPSTLSRFVQNAPAWVKQRELQLREESQRSTKLLRDARIAYMSFQRGVQDRQVRVAEAREERLAKAGAAPAGGGSGGGAGGVPAAAKPASENARREVLTYLKAQNLLAPDAGMRNLQISSLTEDALTLAQRNRGISSFAEALQYAVENAKQRGELVEETSRGRKRFNFNRQEGSAARPINITAESRNVQYVEGKHYRDPQGNVVRFEKGSFKPVYTASPRNSPQPSMPTANNPLLEDDEEEGDE